jgi:hypothetical protein
LIGAALTVKSRLTPCLNALQIGSHALLVPSLITRVSVTNGTSPPSAHARLNLSCSSVRKASIHFLRHEILERRTVECRYGVLMAVAVNGERGLETQIQVVDTSVFKDIASVTHNPTACVTVCERTNDCHGICCYPCFCCAAIMYDCWWRGRARKTVLDRLTRRSIRVVVFS